MMAGLGLDRQIIDAVDLSSMGASRAGSVGDSMTSVIANVVCIQTGVGRIKNSKHFRQ